MLAAATTTSSSPLTSTPAPRTARSSATPGSGSAGRARPIGASGESAAATTTATRAPAAALASPCAAPSTDTSRGSAPMETTNRRSAPRRGGEPHERQAREQEGGRAHHHPEGGHGDGLRTHGALEPVDLPRGGLEGHRLVGHQRGDRRPHVLDGRRPVEVEQQRPVRRRAGMLAQEGRRRDRPSLLHRGVGDLVRQAAQADHAERDALEGGGTGLRIGAGEEGGHVDDELVDGVADPHAEVVGHVRAQDDLVRRVGVRSSALRDERSISGGVVQHEQLEGLGLDVRRGTRRIGGDGGDPGHVGAVVHPRQGEHVGRVEGALGPQIRVHQHVAVARLVEEPREGGHRATSAGQGGQGQPARQSEDDGRDQELPSGGAQLRPEPVADRAHPPPPVPWLPGPLSHTDAPSPKGGSRWLGGVAGTPATPASPGLIGRLRG